MPGGGGGELKPMGIGMAIFLTVFSLFWWTGVGLLDVTLVSGFYRQARSAHYATTTGVVTQSNVRVSGGHRSASYIPELRYAFDVGGREFTGSRYRFDFLGGGKDAVHAIVASYPVGAGRGLFRSGQPGRVAAAPGAGWGRPVHRDVRRAVQPRGTGHRLDTRLRRAGDGGPFGDRRVPLWEDGFQVRVRMPVVPPLVCGLVAGGGAALLAIFVVAIATGGHPSIAVMGLVWRGPGGGRGSVCRGGGGQPGVSSTWCSTSSAAR